LTVLFDGKDTQSWRPPQASAVTGDYTSGTGTICAMSRFCRNHDCATAPNTELTLNI
jgi:hypothetical protein